MRLLKAALLSYIALYLCACKIQVTATDDGTVGTSSGNYSCDAGEVCTIDVSDSSFDEAFTAVPAEGFRFIGWKKEKGHFCGGSDKACALKTQGFDANPVLRDLLAGDRVFFVEPRFQPGSYRLGDVVFSPQSFEFLSDQVGQLHTADLNADGQLDLIVTAATFPFNAEASRGPQQGVILFNLGDNTFIEASGDRPASEHASELYVADFNGDDRQDIFVADHGYDAEPFPGYKNQLLLGVEGGFLDVTDRLPDFMDFSHNAAVGDIDSDGDIDIFVMNFKDAGDGTLPYLLINDGSANFQVNVERLPASLRDTPQLQDSFSAELSDLDDDGFPDLVIGRVNRPDGVPTRIHWNNGNGTFDDRSVSFLADQDVFGGLEWLQTIEIKGIDLTGDGLKDLLVHGYDSRSFAGISVQLLVNQGGRVFSDETRQRLGRNFLTADPNLSPPGGSLLHDYNGDGIKDINWRTVPVVDDAIRLSEGTAGGDFTHIAYGDFDLAEEDQVLFDGPLLHSDNALGFVQLILFEDGDSYELTFNYLPLIIDTDLNRDGLID